MEPSPSNNPKSTPEPTTNDYIKYERRSRTQRKIKGGKREMLLGLGFWIQGFRCFPWMAVIFFLKDGLGVDPSTLQILLNSANLRIRFIFTHRIPYIAGGALLQAISWFEIASSPSTISFFTITTYLILGNLGASIVEVANDAVVAECAKQSTNSDLQSLGWVAAAIGGIAGNPAGGLSVDRFSAQAMFLFFGILLILQFFITVSISEKSLDLPKNKSKHGIKSQFSELLVVLRKPEIHQPIIWFSASFAVIPALTGSMFFYQTQHLNIESSVLGVSKVFGQIPMLLWGVVYNRHLKSLPPRKLISMIQVTMAVLMVSHALFVNRFYQSLGIPDSLYVVIVSGFLEVVYFFKILPFSVLMAKEVKD